jgi:hypothetical protein
MPRIPEDMYRAFVEAAEHDVDEILTRRREGRAKRAAALSTNTRTINFKIEFSGSPIAAITSVSMTAQTAGYLLAVGDSWFDYPIHDILTRLEDNYGYNIESSAHKGDPIETMVSRVGQLDKFSRCLDKIIALGAKPKAILISGGGDDIAGDQFGMLINNIDLRPFSGWNNDIIEGVIHNRIALAYRMMVLKINFLCKKELGRAFPIVIHGYDYPVPDGRGFLVWPFPGPWLKPGFDEKLYVDLELKTQMMVTVIDQFNDMLQELAKEPNFENVNYIDLRKTLSNNLSRDEYKDWWANEIHPNAGGIYGGQDGWGAIASKFQAVLAKLP